MAKTLQNDQSIIFFLCIVTHIFNEIQNIKLIRDPADTRDLRTTLLRRRSNVVCRLGAYFSTCNHFIIFGDVDDVRIILVEFLSR